MKAEKKPNRNTNVNNANNNAIMVQRLTELGSTY